MPGGTLTLSYSGTTIEIGEVTSINESLQKSCTVVPLVSMSMDDTFSVESRSSKTINIAFTRVNPSSGLNNANWITQMENAMNRWQCRTDGFRLVYNADSDNPYIAEINENGYVKSFTHQYSSGDNTVIKGRIEFHVGTMYVDSNIPGTHQEMSAPQNQFTISMTDSQNSQSFWLLNEAQDINCVESYSLYGGPQNPFEYLTMTIPRNRLAGVASALTEDGGIVAGMNQIQIRAVGISDLTVTKCKMSNNNYTITAYCNADRLRGYTLTDAIELTPMEVVRYILGATSASPFGVSFTGANLIIHAPSQPDIGRIKFASGTNVWYALQIAAMCMGCTVFFTNNKAYVIDYRTIGSGTDMESCGTIDLYPTSGDASLTVGTINLGDEGRDTIVNSIQIRATVNATDDDGNFIEIEGSNPPRYQTTLGNVECKDQASIDVFFGQSGGIISAEGLTELSAISITPEPTEEEPEPEPIPVQEATFQASTFGNNYLSYRSEPQQSIEYTAKEMHQGGSSPIWAPTYLPVAWANTIIDDVDNVTISNRSDLDSTTKPQKLFLSSYERRYPEGLTVYQWGVLANIDLSSSTSQIMSSLSNM